MHSEKSTADHYFARDKCQDQSLNACDISSINHQTPIPTCSLTHSAHCRKWNMEAKYFGLSRQCW